MAADGSNTLPPKPVFFDPDAAFKAEMAALELALAKYSTPGKWRPIWDGEESNPINGRVR